MIARDDTTGGKLIIQSKQIQSENAVRLLGVKIDHRRTFDEHSSEVESRCAAERIEKI